MQRKIQFPPRHNPIVLLKPLKCDIIGNWIEIAPAEECQSGLEKAEAT